jgi:hypothetical protein
MFFLVLLLCLGCDALRASNMTWHVVWVGGQSNSVGTNSQTTGYPTWPLTPRIQMFCYDGQRGCATGSFSPAAIPVFGESNVGFSLTYANLVLQTLPADHGIVLVNTGVGGTGFHDGRWVAPTGALAVRSVTVMKALYAAFPANLSGTYAFHSMLWHQVGARCCRGIGPACPTEPHMRPTQHTHTHAHAPAHTLACRARRTQGTIGAWTAQRRGSTLGLWGRALACMLQPPPSKRTTARTLSVTFRPSLTFFAPAFLAPPQAQSFWMAGSCPTGRTRSRAPRAWPAPCTRSTRPARALARRTAASFQTTCQMAPPMETRNTAAAPAGTSYTLQQRRPSLWGSSTLRPWGAPLRSLRPCPLRRRRAARAPPCSPPLPPARRGGEWLYKQINFTLQARAHLRAACAPHKNSGRLCGRVRAGQPPAPPPSSSCGSGGPQRRPPRHS